MGRYPSLLDPVTIANPYPLYHRLREEDPVHWDEDLQTWVLTRYQDVEALLHDPRLSSNRVAHLRNLKSPSVPESTRQELQTTVSMWMLFTDPPDHKRLRNLVNKAFTPRMVENLRPHIVEIVDELLAAAASAGRLDIIKDFAYPLPAIVIAEMLGISREDRGMVKRWSDDLAVMLGGTGSELSNAEGAARSIRQFSGYLQAIVDDRRQHPREDLITGLLKAEEQGSLLSHDELLANCALLVFAGHETTTNLIGNGVLALLRHPDQLRRLQSDGELIKSGVEELLRFDSPVQATNRSIMEDFQLAGRTLQKGQDVLLLLGAANHDPARFPSPDTLDLGRSDNHHGAFAFGPHYCLGAPLARLEAQIAIPALLEKFPDLQLASHEVAWRDNFVLRGLKSLPVTFTPRVAQAKA